LNGGTQSLSPIDMNADAKTSEEKINELEEELASFDGIRFLFYCLRFLILRIFR
jgi:hypothetical protein